jgi:2-phospho-L-lactate/phosphoenolpyruvate guanylyltransferase
MSPPSPSPSPSPSTSWSLVVPVKRLAMAKSRLREFSAPTRAELALAFAADTVAAALACPLVHLVVVVTDEPSAAHEIGGLGALVVPDRPDAGLNAALRYGAREAGRRLAGSAVGALAADLPALRPAELGDALAGGAGPAWFVADAAGTGTTLLAARDPAAFRPAFGRGSARRHRDGGAAPVGQDLPSVRRDVDTVADLRAALDLGVGLRTSTVARRLGLAPRLG